MEVLGAFGIQLEKKIQKLSDDPGHIGFVFFPQRKILGHLFLISPSLSFNHLANTVLEQAHVEIHFQNSVFLGPWLPSGRVKGLLHIFPGEGWEGGAQNPK